MSLPSQTARTTPAGRSFVYRRRKSRRNLGPLAVLVGAGVVFALVLIGLLIFKPWKGGGEPNGTAAAIVDPLSEEGRIDENRNEPMVINQGARQNGGERFTRPTATQAEQNRRAANNASTARSNTDRENGRDTGRPATASLPEEDVAIPDLVPPPLEENRGMLDEAMNENGRTDRPITPAPRPANTQTETTPASTTPARTTPRRSNSPVSAHLDAADTLLQRNDPLAARQALWDAMRTPGLDELQLDILRSRLSTLNNDLLFGPANWSGDPLTKIYEVKSGDSLSRIAAREDLGTHWKLIQRVNQLSSPQRIRVGQKLKLIPGTFHAVVSKSEFRLDLYHGPTEDVSQWKFIRSFDVGLGEGGSTPVGQFIVRDDGKLENPGWVNPRDHTEKYGPDDPANPIGDYWVGLQGLGDAAAHDGYGLHGTIDPDSIGRERSMGCVRMRSDDIALIYEILSEGRSVVRIAP